MHSLKLIQVGGSVGVILPKETLAKLRVGKGDTLFLTEGPDGYRLTPYERSAEQIGKSRVNFVDYR